MRILRASDRPRADGRDAHAGFTMIEVVLALIIVALIAMLALPYARPNTAPPLLTTRVYEIVELLRAERNAALRSGRSSKVVVDGKNGVIIPDSVQRSIAVPSKVALRLLPDSADAIVFGPDGRSSGGRLLVAYNAVTYVIEINRITAAVSLSEAQM